jgi:hypothetical protein
MAGVGGNIKGLQKIVGRKEDRDVGESSKRSEGRAGGWRK